MVEGLDGAGKRTFAAAVTAELQRRGRSVIRRAFPRYDEDVHAELAKAALHGELGDVVDSVHGMAVLFALDRRAARDVLRADLERHDVVLLDRYLASNAAYGAARLRQDSKGEFVRWAHDLEVTRFGLPIPDLQILLQVPVAVAADRAAHREATEAGRDRDAYESDAALQTRCAEVYRELATTGWLSPWLIVDNSTAIDIPALVDHLTSPTREA